MADLNCVILVGRLTRDPELRYIPSGDAVATVSLAVNRVYNTRDGERKEETAFIPVVAWRRQAEICSEHLHKGSAILVEGRLQMRSWENAQGERRSKLEVIARRIQFLDRRGASREGPSRPPEERIAPEHAAPEKQTSEPPWTREEQTDTQETG